HWRQTEYLRFPVPPSLPKPCGGSLYQPDQDASADEEQHLLGLGDDGHCGRDEVDPPEQRIAPDGFGGQLVGAVSDDTDHAGTHSVEHRLHPGETTVECIKPAESDHHEERRPYKGQSD